MLRLMNPCDGIGAVHRESQPLDEEIRIRVEVNCPTSAQVLLELQLLGQQTTTPSDCATAFCQGLDDRCSPFADRSGRKACPKGTR